MRFLFSDMEEKFIIISISCYIIRLSNLRKLCIVMHSQCDSNRDQRYTNSPPNLLYIRANTIYE